MLSINDHSRDSAGLTYVYPVVSRRAGGVSVGINLNPNNACNWACMYCQVPGLTRGAPPPVDLALLEQELRGFLHEAVAGDYLSRHAPPEARRLVDVAFSGNGEPTSEARFDESVACVERVLESFGLLKALKIRLITNGSLMHRPAVRQGIACIGRLDGEVWFKIDRATSAGVQQVNGVPFSLERTRDALIQCAELAPTWVQTCWFALDGQVADETEQRAYLDLIDGVKDKIKGVLLYGLARPSLQPEAERLSPLAPEIFQAFSDRLVALGVKVIATP